MSLINNLGIEPSGSAEEIKNAIRNRVTELLNDDPELLMSYLYRLDVEEIKIQGMLASGIDPIDGFTNLIFERQIARMKTKITYKQDPIEGWDDF